MEKVIIDTIAGGILPEEIKVGKDSKRFKQIRTCILISGLSVFAQLYLFQPMLSLLCRDFEITPAMSSLAVSSTTIGMAVGLFIFAFKADAISRQKLMSITLFISSLLTILSAFVGHFYVLVLINFLKGVVLSGVSAVALAYLSEEVSVAVIGLAISLYLSGNTIGGMSGRVVAILVSGWQGWRAAAVVIGIISLLLSLIFMKKFPESKHFQPKSMSVTSKFRQMVFFIKTPLFLGMYVIAALIMGIFVSVYNYLNFILEEPPFSLPHYVIAMIFLMYTIGVAGSVLSGKWSDKISPDFLLKGLLFLMLVGLLMLQVMHLWAVVLGLGLVTFAFFGAHTMASRIVSQQAKEEKSSATCLYWLFYYLGSSFTGSLTGVVLFKYGWAVFMGVTIAMVIVALLVSLAVTPKLSVAYRFVHRRIYAFIRN
ncbi:MFS transporter [uncultured Bacteroides sp.]|uniref:MFS transporter n=1 Tax=uncultured Bacteroides sp. TaxID=162156 RepID=UPI002AA71E78|nr:MFS transporter [uncultured Bacteroides sp.]